MEKIQGSVKTKVQKENPLSLNLKALIKAWKLTLSKEDSNKSWIFVFLHTRKSLKKLDNFMCFVQSLQIQICQLSKSNVVQYFNLIQVREILTFIWHLLYSFSNSELCLCKVHMIQELRLEKGSSSWINLPWSKVEKCPKSFAIVAASF